MKVIRFLGDSEKRIAEFPENVMIRVLHELNRLRHGLDPTNWKPMRSVGPGVREIRVRSSGAFRVIYTVTRPDAVWVLHAFRKTSTRTRIQDIELARKRFRDL
jgi:phage-related protein